MMSNNVGSPPVATEPQAIRHDAKTLNAVPTPTMPNRKYPRANFHDYNGGMYFVTVCTKDKVHYFGKIRNGEMHHSLLGKTLEENILDVASHYPDVLIPLHVVMPNHFHAIVCIDGEGVGSPPVATSSNEAKQRIRNLGRLNQLARLTVATGGDPTLTTHHCNRLGVVMAGIKAHVTRFAKQNKIDFAWQSRYHDHIIRHTREGNNIAEYIETNVARWDSDCFYN